jgi:hypothetical protein
MAIAAVMAHVARMILLHHHWKLVLVMKEAMLLRGLRCLAP